MLKWLSEASRRRLAAAGHAVELNAGALLFQAGDAGDAAYVVLSGEVEVRNLSVGGRELRHSALGAGRLVGEMAALDGGPRSADVKASRRSRLWRMPRAAMLEALESDPKAAVALVVELSGRLRAANAELQAAVTLDLAGRLARLLIQEQGPRGLAALTQGEMARRIGASREKVNRRLQAWAADGWIELGPAGVRVARPDALRPLFEGPRQ